MKRKKMLIAILIVFISVIVFENIMLNKTKDFNVYNEYESNSTNEVILPLDGMNISNNTVKIFVDGKVHVSVDTNNRDNSLFIKKNKFQFIGEILIDDYILVFDEKNSLISTELLLNENWSIYASNISTTTTVINDTIYFLGITVLHDKAYNIENLSLDIYDTNKLLIGHFDFSL